MNTLHWLRVLLFAAALALGSGLVVYAQDEPLPDQDAAVVPGEPLPDQAEGVSNSFVYLPFAGTQDVNGYYARALELVSQRSNVPPEDLTVVNAGQAEYPLQGQAGVTFKIVDKLTGQPYQVALDANGVELDTEQLAANEQAIYRSRYGNLEPALAELLTSSSVDSVPVILWLNEPYTEPAPRPDPDDEVALASTEQQDAYFAQVDMRRAAAVEAVAAPMAGKLEALGGEVTAAKYDPVLYASLAPAVIAEVAGWPEVDMVYLDRINQPDLEVARPTINGNIVNSRGITGSGVRVAQIEVGGRIATSNPYLAGVTQNTTYVCSAASSHSTGVAGIIRSTHSTRRGIASAAILWAGGSCNGYSSQLQNRSTVAADWGARSLNLSWGSNIGLVPGANDRFYDSMVINRYRSIVKSAGNEAGPCNSGTGNVSSPGLAYNVVTVGNFDDRNTVSWTGDLMDSCSSWRDPVSTHNDREKPEVSAPGSFINSTTSVYPWTGAIGSGTSFAAPAVTGATALLLQRNAGLTSWPEAVKAILMATAIHNVEGAARLSEYDGAGAVVLDRADDVARRVNGNWGAQSYSCSTTTPLNVATMSLVASVRTRVVIAWDNDPAYAFYASRPGADLDLHVLNPSGALVSVSSSWDNTYEIVDFTPTVTGNYTLRIVRYRCDYSPRWLGWAWRRGS